MNSLDKWRCLFLLAGAELLVMAVWFSASAVVPTLNTLWALDANGSAWLTMSVQVGFVVGAFCSALFTLTDRVPAQRLFSAAALLAGGTTLMIALFADGLALALPLRFLTGVFLAGVYPVGMKLVATWTTTDRGLGIGLLVGALAVGSGLPHLLNLVGGVTEWRTVLLLAAASATLGAIICGVSVTPGPYVSPSPRFQWRHIGTVIRDRDVMLANLGYLGHMWELYAMWTWLPAFLLSSFVQTNVDPRWASALAFSVLALGGLGSLLAGKLADRVGRTTVTTLSLLISGACALGIGFFYGGSPLLLALVALVWGCAVVADSAQFSASVSELADKQLIGTALTLQTSMGFLLTLISIRLLPVVEDALGWQWAFAFLALGPAVGIWAMLTLRRLPAASRLANGNK